jgi:hypothetical protein
MKTRCGNAKPTKEIHMTTTQPEAVKWLRELLESNYGRSTATCAYAAGRRAGLTPADIRHARRTLGVEVWGKWWRLPAKAA